MKDLISVIGDEGKKPLKYNPGLANELNKQAEIDEKRSKLEVRLGEKVIPSFNSKLNNPSQDGFIYVPSIRLYVAEKRTLQGKNWYQAHEELSKKDSSMLTIPQFWKFVEYLQKEYQDRIKAEEILDDLLTARNPFRAEWLDARFEKKNNKLLINFKHRFDLNRQFFSQRTYDLAPCLKGASYAELQFNTQGLPTSVSETVSYIPGKKFFFISPIEGKVAIFSASDITVSLSCNEDLSSLNPHYGVREACKNVLQNSGEVK